MHTYTTGAACPFCGSLNVRETGTKLRCDGCRYEFGGLSPSPAPKPAKRTCEIRVEQITDDYLAKTRASSGLSGPL